MVSRTIGLCVDRTCATDNESDNTESARQRHLRRKKRRRWIWGFFGLSITIGASMLAYTYSPLSVKAPLPTSGLDASSVSSMNSGPDASSLISTTTSVGSEGFCLGD